MTSARRSTSRRKFLHGAVVLSVLGFLALPIVVIIPSAFSAGSNLSFPPRGFSIKWFENLLSRPEFSDALRVSATVSALSTLTALVAGTLVAFALTRYEFRGRQVLEQLFLMPLIVPPIIYAVSIFSALMAVGLTATTTGLFLAHSILVMPYVVRTVTATLVNLNPSYEEVARLLGANRWRMFYLVTLPMIRPALVASTTFAAIMSFDEFTVSLFLTGPGFRTLPVAIYDYVDFNIDPTIAAISTIMIAFSVISLIVIERTVGIEQQMRSS